MASYPQGRTRVNIRNLAFKISFFLLFALIFSPNTASAIGISPVTVEVLNIPQQAEITREIFITRGNPATDARAKVSLSGPVGQYVSLPQGEIMNMPKGQTTVAVPFIIKPGTLGTGVYEVKITVAPLVEPASGEIVGTAGSRVLAGAQGTIRFSVTTNAIEDFEINNVNIRETEEGQVVGFSYQLVNRGNVDARPTKIEFTATDVEDTTNVYSETILGETLPPVRALSTGQVDVATKMQPRVGRYQTEFSFFNKDQVIFTYDRIVMQIFPRGTLAQKGELIAFAADKPEYRLGEPVKLSADFKNTGQIGLTTALAVEIFRKDIRVETLKQEAPFVPMGETVKLENFFKPTEGGKYRAKAYASFGPYRSNELSTDFKVKEFNMMLVFILLGVITLALAGVLWWLHKRKKNRMNKVDQQPLG